MIPEWIADYKYFVDSTANFDYLEPYSTISILVVAVPTFMFSAYVYLVAFRKPMYRTAYFRIFITHGFICMFGFTFNLLRLRLALFAPFGLIYKYLSGSATTTVLCTLSDISIRIQLLAESIMSVNRLFAVFRPLEYSKSQQLYTRIGFAVLFIIPALVSIPNLIIGFYYGARFGARGTVIFFTSTKKDQPVLLAFTHFFTNGYVFVLIMFALLSNSTLAVALFVKSRRNTVKTTSSNRSNAEKGLAVATIAQFLPHFAYAVILFYGLSFAGPSSMIGMFTTIAVDTITILPIWILMGCSKSARAAVRASLCKDAENHMLKRALTRMLQFHVKISPAASGRYAST